MKEQTPKERAIKHLERNTPSPQGWGIDKNNEVYILSPKTVFEAIDIALFEQQKQHEVKQEAIKWIKEDYEIMVKDIPEKFRDDKLARFVSIPIVQRWMNRFNIIESDLK